MIFNRSDRHSAFPESDQQVIAGMEQQLLRGADHVLYVSRALMGEERPMAGERAYFLDHGVDLEHFRSASEITPPDQLADLSGPVIGFFGALDDFVVDFDLLERLAVEIPEATLVLVGDSAHSMERLTRYPNVRWLGFQPYAQIPALGSRFDVALMPWLDSSWIQLLEPDQAQGVPGARAAGGDHRVRGGLALSRLGAGREQPRRVHRAGPPDARGRWAGYP